MVWYFWLFGSEVEYFENTSLYLQAEIGLLALHEQILEQIEDLLWTNLTDILPRESSAKFNWNLLSGFREKYENATS